MNKVLIICNTVLQIIFATNLKYTLFLDCDVDLVISDHTKNTDRIAKNPDEISAFSHIYHVKTAELDHNPAAIVSKGALGLIKDELKKENILKQIIELDSSYDMILTANLDKFAELVFECQYKHNKAISLYMYEDGLSAYCVLGEQLKKKRHAEKSSIHTAFDYALGKQYAHNHIKGIYLFDPGLCAWDDCIPFLKMPKIDKDNKKLVQTLNALFNYSQMKDHYNTKYIFFEESYHVEGIEVNDLELVNTISEIVGKENIFVKTHPRNRVNRFEELGYKTNEDTFIPWELIALNENIEDKVLLSIASGSIANPYLMLGLRTKSIVLLKCANGFSDDNSNIYNDFLFQKVYSVHTDIFCIPENIDGLKMILQEGFS